jgi:hypothetical protein
VLLLAACSDATVAVSPGGRAGSDDSAPPEEVTGADSAAEGETGEEEEPDAWPKSCEDLYDQDELQTFDLDFRGDAWEALQADCSSYNQTYRPVDLTWNGETVAASVRLKGNWSWTCSKLQFVVSFNEQDSEARFHGLRKLVFDAPWYDRTLLHERLAFPLFERLGLPYSCANNARVNVNGEYYGLYANLERLDHEYLERNFENPDGNLYQGGSELKTNEDVGDTSDLAALKAAVTADEIAALVDLDEATAEWAAEAVIPALDNYWAGVEINYYLYHHPDRGFLYLPYDLDIAFGDSAYTDGTLVWQDGLTADPITWEHTGWLKEPILKTVLADPAWCDVYVEKVAEARAAYDPDEMQARIDAWSEQIADAYDEDPHKMVSTADHVTAVASLRLFVEQRAEVVDDWLAQGGHCPARW